MHVAYSRTIYQENSEKLDRVTTWRIQNYYLGIAEKNIYKTLKDGGCKVS